MTSDSSDFVLLASFLQNKQSEKQNATLRLIHDIVEGTKKDKSLLTNELELSVTELEVIVGTNPLPKPDHQSHG